VVGVTAAVVTAVVTAARNNKQEGCKV